MTEYMNTIYGKVNQTYTGKLCKYIADTYFPYEGKLLDVGCGKGSHADMFQQLGFETHGVDMRDDWIHPLMKVVDLENGKLPYDDNTFDFIFSKSVMEHIHKPDNLFNEMLRVLKPGGRCAIMTPDWFSQMHIFWDDYSHYHAYTRKSLRDALTIFGFKGADCKLFYQLPFIWKYPWLRFIPKLIALLPDFLKWKNNHQRNGEDRPLIRFSKELMLFATARK